jgi:hypothetical protein
MVTIEITAPTHCGTDLLPGDRITVARLTPELQKMLTNTRVDGAHVARLVKAGEDDELAVTSGEPEMATTGRRRSAVRAIEA